MSKTKRVKHPLLLGMVIYAVIFLAVAAGSYFLDLTPVVFVVTAAVLGIILKNMGGKKA